LDFGWACDDRSTSQARASRPYDIINDSEVIPNDHKENPEKFRINFFVPGTIHEESTSY